MITHHAFGHKFGRPVLLAVVASLALTATSPPQPDEPDCQALIDELDHAYDARRNSGADDWAALDPLVARAHRCFGEARTPAHARLFDYETSILNRQRRFADAEAVFEHFFDAYAEVAAPSVLARMHVRRGLGYNRLGRTAAMLAEYTHAAALADRLPPSEAASTLSRVGEQYRLVHDLDAAHRYFAEAETLLVRLYAEDPEAHGPDLGLVRLRRAIAFLNAGEQGKRPKREAAEAAAPLVESALRLIPATPFHAFHRTHALLRLVEIAWAREAAEQALAPLAEARRLSPWFREANPQLMVQVGLKEGYTQFLLGRFDGARRAYEAALAEAVEANEGVWWVLDALGDLAEEEAQHAGGDFAEAEAFFRRAAAEVDAIRRGYGTHTWSAATWEETQEPYLDLTRILLRQGRAAEAFLVLDATRARYLRDLRTAIRLRDRLDLHDAQRLDSLTRALADVRRALADPALPLGERTRLEYQEVVLRRQSDALTGISEAPEDRLTLAEVQQALRRRGQILLTYFLDEDLPTAFVVRPDTIAAVSLPAGPEAVQAEVARLAPLWDEARPTVSLAPLRRLYRALVEPVAPLLEGGGALVVIPEGPLAQVPFGLLLDADHPPYDYADAPYLLRRFAVSTELAAALLAAPEAPGTPPLDVIALGRSRYEGLPSPAAGRSADALIDLPNVRDEIRHLRRRLDHGRFALNEEATEAFLMAHLGDARILHLAGHAFVDPDLPLYSHIVLWNAPEHDDDGVLYLYELQDRSLDADLVTLSGCGTARGKRHVGEGMMGLQYAFRAAGADATLATLWQVDDAATVELMDAFYRGLRRGLPKDRALQQAQLAYLDRHAEDGASPFLWAAPVLYGDPAPLTFRASASSAAVWLPLGLALIAAGLALPRLARRRRRKGETGNG